MRRDMGKFHPDNWKYQRFQLPIPENSQSYFRKLPSGLKECFVDGTDWNQATKKAQLVYARIITFGQTVGFQRLYGMDISRIIREMLQS